MNLFLCNKSLCRLDRLSLRELYDYLELLFEGFVMSKKNIVVCALCPAEFNQVKDEALCPQCETDYCNRCNNRGWVQMNCNYCNEGEVPCSCTQGKSVDPDDDSLPSCYICEGERVVTCPACNGQTEEPCDCEHGMRWQ